MKRDLPRRLDAKRIDDVRINNSVRSASINEKPRRDQLRYRLASLRQRLASRLAYANHDVDDRALIRYQSAKVRHAAPKSLEK